MKQQKVKTSKNEDPIYPIKGMPFISLGKGKDNGDYYFDPYNNRALLRNSTTGAYTNLGRKLDGNLGINFPDPSRIKEHLKDYPDTRGLESPKYQESILDTHTSYKDFIEALYKSPDIARRLANDGFKTSAQRSEVKNKRLRNLADSRVFSTTRHSEAQGNTAFIAGDLEEQNTLIDLYGVRAPRETITAHELTHTVNRPLDPQALGPRELALLKKGFRNPQANKHDQNPIEWKADLTAMKYHLSKDGALDLTGKSPMTLQTLKLMKQKYRSNATFKRTFDNFDDATILKHLNDFTTVQDKPTTQNVAYGGSIDTMKRKKYNIGGDLQGNGLDLLSAGVSMIPGWGQVAGAGLGLVSGLVKRQQAVNELRNTVITGTPGNYAQGGDIALNSQSFQVKDNPAVKDGKDYDYKGSPVSLDHNEVVDTKQDFVFSNRILNPLTFGKGKKAQSFADSVAKIDKSTGKAEKMVQHNNSPEAMNTIKYNNMTKQSLGKLQEAVKVRTMPSTGMANGGPIPWDGFGVKQFQQYANSLGYVDPTTKKPLAIDNAWGPQTEAAFNTALGTDWASQLGMENVNGKYTRTSPQIIDSGTGISIPNAAGTQFANIDKSRPSWMPKPAAQDIVRPQMTTLPDGTQVDIAELGGDPTTTPLTMDQRASHVTPSVTTSDDVIPSFERIDPTTVEQKGLMPNSSSSRIGNVLQGIEVASKFLETMQPAEKQRPYLDTTNITKQSYDPRNARYQNQRNYQNAVNTIDSPSINLRRALQNKFLSNKINSDMQVNTQYDQMNKNAQTQFEDRLSNRRRYNNAQMLQTDTINSQNRAAKDAAIQNAFTSVGNYGEAMNRRDQAYDSLNVLKELYPDVYDRIMNEYSTGKRSITFKAKAG